MAKKKRDQKIQKTLEEFVSLLEEDVRVWPSNTDIDFEFEQAKCKEFMSDLSHESLLKRSCGVCWELHFSKDLIDEDVSDSSKTEFLEPLLEGSWNRRATFNFKSHHSHLNGYPLLDTALSTSPTESSILRVCTTCLSSLRPEDDTKVPSIPSRSIANDLWIGDQTSTMKSLNIPSKLLVCPIRGKAYIVKLKNYADPRSRQRGMKGNTIAFPQDNHLEPMESDLPRDLSVLDDDLLITFVGNTKPTEKQLEKMFRVTPSQLIQVLNQWRDNGHPGFQLPTWNVDNLESIRSSSTVPIHEVMSASINVVGNTEEKSVDVETQSYVPPLIDDDDQDQIIFQKLGIVDANTQGGDREALKKSTSEALLIGHGREPVCEYYNHEYWVNSYPWLFPFGSGGAEHKSRPTKLTLREWVRHCLKLEDPRFRTDPSFVFFAFNVLQKRDIYSKTKVLFDRVCASQESLNMINDPTFEDFVQVLEVMTKKSKLDLNNPIHQRIQKLMSKIKIVGSHVKGSVYDRGACRHKITGLIGEIGLPNLFITLNPSDINNPIVSFWNSLGGDSEFNLDTLLPQFPSQSQRAQIVSDDPVHSAEFFYVYITSFLESFLGFKKQSSSGSSLQGPLYNETIFSGRNSRGLKGFFGTVETQGRGSLHLHLLVWLHGPPQPKQFMESIVKASDDLKRYKRQHQCSSSVDDDNQSDSSNPPPSASEKYLRDVSSYLESIIQESFIRFSKDEQVLFDNTVQPDRVTLFSKTPQHCKSGLSADTLDSTLFGMKTNLKYVVDQVNKHECKDVCTKYGSKSCRFNYPRPIVQVTDFREGVVFLKRLDTRCNPYNRAMMSVMRHNMDIKFITNGQDAKSVIFYITDYVTKSELSVYQSVSLAQIAVSKINDDPSSSKNTQGLTTDQNKARRRIYTLLNKLDSDVERSAQWVSTCLLGFPLEYSSHKFLKLNVHSFVNYVETHAKEPGDLDSHINNSDFDVDETTVPVLDMKKASINFVNKRLDYTLRTDHKTDRWINRSQSSPTFKSEFTSIEQELAQMSPFEYVQRVTKLKLNSRESKMMDEENSTDVHLSSQRCFFSNRHPQYKTHVQSISRVTNPKIPVPIPVFHSFSLPLYENDPRQHAIMVLSVLTPYQTPDDLITNEHGRHVGFVESYDSYLKRLVDLDPHLYTWLVTKLNNMRSITEGREQQRLEKIEREKLRIQQGIIDDENEVLGPYDYNDDTEVDVGCTNAEKSELISNLPSTGPFRSPDKYQHELNIMAEDSDTVPATTNFNRYRGTNISGVKKVLQTIHHLGELLKLKKDSLYKVSDVSNISLSCIPDDFVFQVASSHNLDDDQRAAFLTIVRHVLMVELWKRKKITEKPNQMLFYLGGEGGTGKSKVVKSLTDYMTRVGLRHTLRLAAPTGTAADNIGGQTLHSLLKIPVSDRSSKKDTKRAPVHQSYENFEPVDTVLIDEISMVGCSSINTISAKISEMKTTTKSFGGLTVIFCGDFYQLPPIQNDPLYCKPSVISASTDTLTKRYQGYLKWAGITHCVFLKTQYRMKDLDYKEFVDRYRHGECTDEDVQFIENKKIGPENSPSSADAPTIIVKNNDLRCFLNFKKAYTHSSSSGEKMLIAVAEDTFNNQEMTTRLRREVLLIPDGSRTSYLAGLLPLFKGMPVIIKNNIATELGICNGTSGVIHDIILDSRESVDYTTSQPHYLKYDVVCVHLRIDSDDGVTLFHLHDLPPNVFPMSTISKNPNMNRKSRFSYKDTITGCNYRVQRKQLWFLPGYSVTVDSAQGRSLKSAILHLGSSYSSNEKPYVMFSRIIHGSKLWILGDLHPDIFCLQPNPRMISHIKSFLDPIEVRTKSSISKTQHEIIELQKRLILSRRRKMIVYNLPNKRSRSDVLINNSRSRKRSRNDVLSTNTSVSSSSSSSSTTISVYSTNVSVSSTIGRTSSHVCSGKCEIGCTL